jgi:hypothetical protein
VVVSTTLAGEPLLDSPQRQEVSERRARERDVAGQEAE